MRLPVTLPKSGSFFLHRHFLEVVARVSTHEARAGGGRFGRFPAPTGLGLAVARRGVAGVAIQMGDRAHALLDAIATDTAAVAAVGRV
mgnify:CR=1 FL=1